MLFWVMVLDIFGFGGVDIGNRGVCNGYVDKLSLELWKGWGRLVKIWVSLKVNGDVVLFVEVCFWKY